MRHLPPMQQPPLRPLALALLLALSACGGNNESPAPTAAASLAGSVAVGAPITDGRLRVLDATGAVIASDVVVAADGSYTVPNLSGTAPWRIEACGYVGETWSCLQSVALAAGTANVTPLTTATVLLASGQSGTELMNGTGSALDANSVNAAQTQLRTALAPVLDGQVPSGFDLISGALQAGSRTGYDRVLDAVGVATGTDSRPFVQITPRLGSGNLYIEAGSSAVGSVTASTADGNLSLDGLEALFARMSAAMASASACADGSTGLAAQMAGNARFNNDGDSIEGAANVAGLLCGLFAEEDLWGSRLMSPTLGRCDTAGASASCRVSVVLRMPDGTVQSLGAGMAVTREANAWKFLGDMLPLALSASARAQRDLRIDGGVPVLSYQRALAVEIGAVPGLACARVSQRDAHGAAVPLALYKRWAGAGDAPSRLSLWTVDGFGNSPSLDPASGAVRSSDDSWIALPDGAAGDDSVRNFLRGGRSLQIALFSDAACSSPLNLAGQNSFEVDVEGVPPVAAALATLPWPELTDTAAAALRNLAVGSGAAGNLTVAWTTPRGTMGTRELTLCTDRASCGDGNPGRAGEGRVGPTTTSANLALTAPAGGISAGSTKTLMLGGRHADGLGLQSAYISCTAQAAGGRCF